MTNMLGDNGNGDWREYRRLVMAELQRASTERAEIKKAVGDVRVDIGMLQVKAGAWGAVGGFLIAAPVAIGMVLALQ